MCKIITCNVCLLNFFPSCKYTSNITNLCFCFVKVNYDVMWETTLLSHHNEILLVIEYCSKKCIHINQPWLNVFQCFYSTTCKNTMSNKVNKIKSNITPIVFLIEKSRFSENVDILYLMTYYDFSSLTPPNSKLFHTYLINQASTN